MIGEKELLGAIESHIQRTAVADADGMAELLENLGVAADDFFHALGALWDERSRNPYVSEAKRGSLYVAGGIDGFILGVRAARAEVHGSAPSN